MHTPNTATWSAFQSIFRRRYRRVSRHSMALLDTLVHRVGWPVVAVFGILVAVQVVWSLRTGIDDPWNDARLAPTVAMLRGFPLWPRPGEGAQLDMIYGPVAALTWIPAAMQPTATRALAVGLVEAFLLSVLPVAWILWIEGRRDPLVFWATVLLSVTALYSTPVLPIAMLHADVPALSFATVALACAWTDARRRHPVWRWLGAAAVIAAVGAKQVMVPLLIVYPLWIAVSSGRRVGVQALGSVVVIGTLALVLVGLLADVDAMWVATVLGPASHPWSHPTATAALAWASLDLVRRAWALGALLVVAIVLLKPRTARWRALVRAHRWLFPLVVAVACLPTTLLGRMKFGGSPNTLAFSVWFLMVAMVTAYASAARRPRPRGALTAVALAAVVILATRMIPFLDTLPGVLKARPLPTVALEAARSAPGTIYFPFRPTVSLLAEGRVHHFTSGIYFRALEGFAFNEARVRAFLPPALERVATTRRYFPDVLDYLPTFRRQVLDPALPGWVVLVSEATHLEPSSAGAAYQVPLPELPVTIPSSSMARGLSAARVTIAERERRYRVSLDATIPVEDVAGGVALDVLLRDASGKHLLTLAVVGHPDAQGRVVAEWPVFDELVGPAATAVVQVRPGSGAA